MSFALSFSLTAVAARRRRRALTAAAAVPMLAFGTVSNSQYVALGF